MSSLIEGCPDRAICGTFYQERPQCCTREGSSVGESKEYGYICSEVYRGYANKKV